MQPPLSNNYSDQGSTISPEALEKLMLLKMQIQERRSTQEHLKTAFIIAFASVFFMFVIIVVKRAMNIGIGPILVAKEPIFQAEIFEPEKNIEHDFILENKGRLPIEIRMTQSDCPCLWAAVVGEANIFPGESATIRSTYSPSLDKEQQSGSVAHILEVYTDYMRQEKLQLIVKATNKY
jgi:hypothetical protein